MFWCEQVLTLIDNKLISIHRTIDYNALTPLLNSEEIASGINYSIDKLFHTTYVAVESLRVTQDHKNCYVTTISPLRIEIVFILPKPDVWFLGRNYDRPNRT